METSTDGEITWIALSGPITFNDIERKITVGTSDNDDANTYSSKIICNIDDGVSITKKFTITIVTDCLDTNIVLSAKT